MVFTFILSHNRTSSNLRLVKIYTLTYGAAIVSNRSLEPGRCTHLRSRGCHKDSSWLFGAKATFPSTLARRSDGLHLTGVSHPLVGFTLNEFKLLINVRRVRIHKEIPAIAVRPLVKFLVIRLERLRY
jgi:hypothetical protein